jgi:hypothetical protein
MKARDLSDLDLETVAAGLSKGGNAPAAENCPACNA